MPSPKFQTDFHLLRELELLSTGDTVHTRLNLVGAYASAIEQFNDTGDQDFRSIADEAHRALRVLLTKLRWRHVAEHAHWK